MRPATIHMSVVVALLAGFIVTLAIAASQGAALLAARPFVILLVVAAIGVLLSVGLTAWDGDEAEAPNAIASGGRTFACVLAGAAAAGAAAGDGVPFAYSCLALAVPVALLSASIDRRAWLST